MRNLLAFFGLCLLQLAAALRPPANLETGLVAYYSFNECNARDDSGNGSHGVLYGDPGCHCGVEDDALLLDGDDDYIVFEGYVNRFFNTSDFTVSFYIKPTGHFTFPQQLLAKREACDSNHVFDIRLNSSLQRIDTDLIEDEFVYLRNLEAELDGTGWMHFAVVREGTRAWTYINGNLRGQGRLCRGVDIGNDALLAFADSPCDASGRLRRFRGVLDELRIYDRALTGAEVAALYARYPIDRAEIDCVSMVPPQRLQQPRQHRESAYLCAFATTR